VSRKRILVALGLVAVASVTALAVVQTTWDRGGGSALTTPAAGSQGIDARATLSPRIIFFGDRMQALFDVTLDRRRVDPNSVRVAPELAPWEIIGTARRERRDAGTTTQLRWTYDLRCLTGPCVPAGATAPFQFSPARVTFAAPGASTGKRDSVAVELPLLVVYSRFSAAGFESVENTDSSWRADVLTLPAMSYRVSPGVAILLLLAGSVLLVVAAGVLMYLAWPRRAPAQPPEPEPEPLPSLTPIEQALALLEQTVRDDGAGDQRRALELVAEELEEWGDSDLALAARGLAWSAAAPPVDQTMALAARVRAELDEELLQRSELGRNGNEHVV
jgi:hypothetical protein